MLSHIKSVIDVRQNEETESKMAYTSLRHMNSTFTFGDIY